MEEGVGNMKTIIPVTAPLGGKEKTAILLVKINSYKLRSYKIEIKVS